MPMSWLRRNRKILMAVMVVVLMVAWGALPALRYMAGGEGRTRGTIRGEPVGPREMQRASRELSSLTRFGLLRRARGLSGFIFGEQESQRASMEAVWRYLVLVREAEAAGVDVVAGEMQGIFAPQGPLPGNDPVLRRAVLNLIKISKLYAFRMETSHVGTAQQWMDYNFRRYAVKLRTVELDPDIFIPVVETSPSEVREFYEERKEQLPDERTGTIGYQAPQRVRMEYALASIEDAEKAVQVSEQQIKDYYEENKSEYVIEEDEAGEDEGEEEETGENAAESETPSDEEANEESSADETAEGDEEPAAEEEGGEATEEEPEYKPLSEVRDEIIKTLTERKAKEHAREKVEKVLDDLEEVSVDYLNEPLPVEQMARRHGLTYARPTVADGRELLSREEIQSTVPGGSKVAQRIFDEELQKNYYSLVETTAGPMVIQILERREPEPKPFDSVREQVRSDLRRHKALQQAKTVAEKIRQKAGENSLAAAVRETNGRLTNLLGPPPEPAEETDEKEEEKPEEGAESSEEAEKKEEGVYLEVNESGFISRSDMGMEAFGTRRPEIIRTAVGLEDGEVAMVVSQPPEAACFVIERLAARQPDPGGFWPWQQQQRFRTMFFGPQQEVQAWLDELLEESPPPSEEEN